MTIFARAMISAAALSALPSGCAKLVFTGLDLQAAIDNGTMIELGSKFFLNETVVINRTTYIDGKGNEVDGQSRVGCFKVAAGAHLFLNNLTVVRCVAQYGGGVLLTGGSSLTATGIIFSNNNASYGGAVAIFEGSSASLYDSKVDRNNAYFGGGLSTHDNSSVLLERCTLVQNAAQSQGGGLWLNASTSVLINALLDLNRADNDGGGIAAFRSSLKLMQTRFTRNKANNGAGLNTKESKLVAVACVLDSNEAGHTGGGLYSDAGSSLHFMDCKILGNKAKFGGGSFINAGAAAFDNCTIERNGGEDSGGGLVAENANVVLRNCNISSNYAAQAGGGLFIIGSVFKFTAGNLAENRAGQSGGGAFFTSNTAANISSSNISANIVEAMVAFVNLTGGTCAVKDNCFFSPSYPHDYGNDETCTFTVLTDAVLDSAKFDTETGFDFLTIEGSVKYSGTQGPSNIRVTPGAVISFTSDHNVVGTGFKICSATNGGGLFAMTESTEIVLEQSRVENNRASYNGGGVAVTNGAKLRDIGGFILNNDAAHLGGGFYIDSATLILARSTVAFNNASVEATSGGNSAYLQYGLLKGTDVSIESDISGPFSSSSASCGSSCFPGSYGTCSAVPGAPECYANCKSCQLCQPGKASHLEGATSFASCVDCPTGHVPDDTSTSCLSCPAGTYATDSPIDASGGVNRQVSVGATSCNGCPRGRYAAHSSALVCDRCLTGRSSFLGSGNCTLCDANYYAMNSNCDECTTHLQCLSKPGRQLPGPQAGYWMSLVDYGSNDDSVAMKAVRVHKCSRNTCKGASPDNSSCWNMAGAGDFLQCAEKDMCLAGSFGPLCGACMDQYVYSPAYDICTSCTAHERQAFATAAVLSVFSAIAFVLYFEYVKLPEQLKRTYIVGSLSMVDTGTLRVAYSTYQITSSVAWTLNFEFPQPFAKMVQLMSILSLDFLHLDCIRNANAFTTVIAWSLIPVALEAFCLLLYAVRRSWARSRQESKEILRQHSSFFFVMTYAVMPPICRFQFEALECIDIAGDTYLRLDTSIDCNSARYAAFKFLDALFILGWMAVPLIWLVILCRKRHRLNPATADRAQALRMQRADKGLNASEFLWMEYEPVFYYWEAVEIYRRVFFVGIVPLISPQSSRKAAFGMFAAISSAVCFRELEPFRRRSTNLLAHVAQYVILLNYGAALCISTGVSDNLNPLLFGVILVAVNLVVVGLGLYTGAQRHYQEESTHKRWRRELNTQEFAVVHAVMQGRPVSRRVSSLESSFDAGLGGSAIAMVAPFDSEQSSNSASSSASGCKHLNRHQLLSDAEELRSAEILVRYLISVDDVVVARRVGAGAYGEVFLGAVLGRSVAIKTMLKVTEENALTFRAEILLTATLKHANVVGFVGACWSRQLVALVLEWVPNGSLGDLLSNRKGLALAWNDPLLRLATDVARGMAYLHGRSYFDEQTRELKTCILHRDLKPDNALVTEFLACKVSDFGTSRAKSDEAVAMTAVGTPLFCAPEVLNGDVYDEKVDVYSFGMLLLAMCVQEPLLEYLAARWCVDFHKDRPPKQPMRLIAKIVDGSWRAFATVAHAPPQLNALLLQCLEVQPRDRPTFDQVLADLSGPVKDQVNSGTFERQPPLNRRMSSEASSSSSSADGSFCGVNSVASSSLQEAPSAQLEAAAGSGSAAPPPPPGPPPPGVPAPGADGAAVVEFGSEMGRAAERRLSLTEGERARNPILWAATDDGGGSRLSQRLTQHNQPLPHARIEMAESSEV